MINRSLAIIANKDVEEKKLLAAIQELGAVTGSAKFWTDIVNSSDYNKVHRRHCVFQLFFRHVFPGMKLSELAQILDGAKWLKDDDVILIEDLGGYIPVKLTSENTVFVLNILPDSIEIQSSYWAIYLSLSGKINRNNFIKLLRDKEVDQHTKDSVILEIGFNPSDPMAVRQ